MISIFIYVATIYNQPGSHPTSPIKYPDVSHPLALRHPIVLQRSQSFLIVLVLKSFRWSVGSGLFLASFAAVMGPMNYVYHLLSTPRLPFTTAYFGSIILTLVFAIKVRLTLP